MKKRSKFRRWAARISSTGLALLVIIPAASLRPVDRSDWSEDEPLETATAIVGAMNLDMARAASSQLEAGWAKRPLSREIGDPLAGYGARRGAPSTAGGKDLFVKALCLRNGTEEVFLVAADILLIHAGVSEKVAALCAPSGIQKESIYFTATHTHCGPGGWGPNVIEESVCGDFSEDTVNRLADDLSRVILAARENTVPAEWSWLESEAPEFIRNRTVKNGTIDPSLEAIAIRKKDSEAVGLFAFYGAHATCMGSKQMAFHADYPGAFVQSMESTDKVEFAAFGAASVGSQSPLGQGEDEDRARFIGQGLAGKLRPLLNGAKWKSDITLASSRETVPLPDFQIRISSDIRIAEWIANGIHPGSAPIHLLRLDKHWLAGLPVEYSGLLSSPIRKEAKSAGLTLTPTAFNGDYIGYVLPPEIYDSDAYETKMNFLGPGGGAYFTELIKIGTGLKLPAKSQLTPPE